MRDKGERLVDVKAGGGKYVDRIRTAITEALLEQGLLSDDEKSFLGRRRLPNMGWGPKLLNDVNVCPFAVVCERGHVRFAARIVDGKVMAIIPNPDYLSSGRRASNAAEVRDLLAGELITQRFVLRLPISMQEGAQPKDYGKDIVSPLDRDGPSFDLLVTNPPKSIENIISERP